MIEDGENCSKCLGCHRLEKENAQLLSRAERAEGHLKWVRRCVEGIFDNLKDDPALSKVVGAVLEEVWKG